MHTTRVIDPSIHKNKNMRILVTYFQYCLLDMGGGGFVKKKEKSTLQANTLEKGKENIID